MRAFNREFGYKTCKHPISCHQSDIRRWITSDSVKECRPCRPFQYSTGNVCDGSLHMKGTSSESYALHVEHLSSAVNLTGARKFTKSDPTVQTILDTSLSDNHEDATSYDVIVESDDNEQQTARHSPLAADGQHVLPNDACPPLLGRDDRYRYAHTELPSTRLETDKRACRYSNNRRNVGTQSLVIVPPTWLTMSSPETSDVHKKCRAFQQESFQANYNLVTD